MAFYTITTDDRVNYDKQTICVKNKETALAVAQFVCKAMYGSCQSYACENDVAHYNRVGMDDGESNRWGEVVVTELEVVG